MGEIASAAALCLAVVFAWAGASKVVRGDATESSFRALGVPSPAAAARLVPLGELALAGLLVTLPRVGAGAALLVLAGFTTFLARAIASGSTAGCGCFGAARAEPVSVFDLYRNGLLLIGAIAATGATGAALPSLPALVLTSVAALLGTVVLTALRTRALSMRRRA